MKSAILVFPGINRERDMARALRLMSGREPSMVWHADISLPPGTDLVVIPGGFSYGDYLRCGAIAARAPIMNAVRAFATGGGLVLAVCNGFQIACEAGLLPGVLMRNAQLRFICRDVYLRVERSDTPFTRGYNAGQMIRVPVALAATRGYHELFASLAAWQIPLRSLQAGPPGRIFMHRRSCRERTHLPRGGRSRPGGPSCPTDETTPFGQNRSVCNSAGASAANWPRPE